MHGSFRTADIRNAEPLPVADREAARQRSATLITIAEAANAGQVDVVKDLAARL